MNQKKVQALAAECADKMMRASASVLAQLSDDDRYMLREAFVLTYIEGLTKGALAVIADVRSDIALLKRQAG